MCHHCLLSLYFSLKVRAAFKHKTKVWSLTSSSIRNINVKPFNSDIVSAAKTKMSCPPPKCLSLTFSFPSSRWMGTRRAWLPTRWTHGTKAPTQPIASTSLPCRTTDRQGINLKLTSAERQTMARKSFHFVMKWIGHSSALAKVIPKEVLYKSFTF